MKTAALLALTLHFLTFSCSESGFEKFSSLESTRILAVVADKPEIDGTLSTPQTVTLTPYISDQLNTDREWTVNVVTFLDPGVAQGAEPRCENPTPQNYAGATFDSSTLKDTRYSGPMPELTLTIDDASSLISSYSEQQKFNGVNFLVCFSMRTQSGGAYDFVKSIPITTRGTLNQNPEIASVTLNGTAISAPPRSGGKLAVEVVSGPEQFDSLSSQGDIVSQSEQLLVSWFAADARVFPGRVLQDQTANLSELRPEIVLVAVLRDGRGGTDIRIFAGP